MNVRKPGRLVLSAVLVVSLAGIGLAKNKHKDKDGGSPHDPMHPSSASSPRSPHAPHGGSSHPGVPHHDCDRVQRELHAALARIAALEGELRACRRR